MSELFVYLLLFIKCILGELNGYRRRNEDGERQRH